MATTLTLFAHHPLAVLALALWSMLGMETWFKNGNEVIESRFSKAGYQDVMCDFNEVWHSNFKSDCVARAGATAKGFMKKDDNQKDMSTAAKAVAASETNTVLTATVPATQTGLAPNQTAECADAEKYRGKWYHTPYDVSLHYVCEVKTQEPDLSRALELGGWTPFQGSFYKFELEKVVRAVEAVMACKAYGSNYSAQLVTIETELENSFVKEMVGRQTVWIGLTKAEGKWTWPHGEPVKYTNWEMSQPIDNSTSETAFMNYWEALCMPPPWEKALEQFIRSIMAVLFIIFIVLPCCFGCSYQKHVTDQRQTIPDFRVVSAPHTPLADNFRFPLFGCCEDMSIFWHSCCCLPFRAADTYQGAGLSHFGHITLWYFLSQVVGSTLGHSGPLTQTIAFFVMALVMTGKRQELKARLGIARGSACEDFFLWWCCAPCVVAQEARELDHAAGVSVKCCFSLRQHNAAGPMVGQPVTTPPGWLAAPQACMQAPQMMSAMPSAPAPPSFYAASPSYPVPLHNMGAPQPPQLLPQQPQLSQPLVSPVEVISIQPPAGHQGPHAAFSPMDMQQGSFC